MAIDNIDTPSPVGEAVPARGLSFRVLAIGAFLLLLIGVVVGGWAVNRWLMIVSARTCRLISQRMAVSNPPWKASFQWTSALGKTR